MHNTNSIELYPWKQLHEMCPEQFFLLNLISFVSFCEINWVLRLSDLIDCLI